MDPEEQAVSEAVPEAESPSASLDTGSIPEHVAAPSGGEPADEFADLTESLSGDPRQEAFLGRLREVATQRAEERRQRQELEQQLQQFQGRETWLQAAERLEQFGATPESFLELLQQAESGTLTPPAPAVAPDPEAAFTGWLQEKGFAQEVYELDPTVEPLYRHMHAVEQQLQTLTTAREAEQVARQQAETQAQQQALEARADAELATVAQSQPLFAGPAFVQDPTHGRIPTLAGIARAVWLDGGGKVPMSVLAARLGAQIQATTQQQIAQYAAAKARDAHAPVPGGGTSAPNPVASVEFYKLSSQEQNALVESYLSSRRNAA